ncbi:MAG: UDP-glucose 4-epimerase [Micromonosporaceae bacterium]|nr:UDP-glucose 4-epimerase [Micromonosporaceae bacterium]
MKVLIAGGAGFIGSTIASACLDNGMTPVILDNLATGRAEFARDRIFYQGDIADGPLIDKIFTEHPEITAVVHAAAVIVVPESVEQPLRYYRENVAKSVEFIDHVVRNGCGRYLFSSSAAIYRPGEDFSVDETSPLEPLSPYARTKMVMEHLLEDCAAAYDLRVVSLRYFNPIGADPQLRSGLQIARPSHLLGKLLTSVETGEEFLLTGVDWPTRDGSGIRDFIHVWDLAEAHVAALRRFDEVLPPWIRSGGPAIGPQAESLAPPGGETSYQVINLGTGHGTTVKEFVAAFEAVTHRALRTREVAARPGDNAGSFTRSVKAYELLGWQPRFTLEQGIDDSARWAALRADRLPA